jgi:hypothetical protein
MTLGLLLAVVVVAMALLGVVSGVVECPAVMVVVAG